MPSYVYLATNRINGKRYVGKANHVQRRWARHVSASRKDLPHTVIARAIRKHGANNFTLEVLEVFDTEREAFTGERRWIQHLKSNVKGMGYNLDEGGCGGSHGRVISPETREKMSLARRERPPATPETRSKMSVAKRGRKLTPEHRTKLAEAHRGLRHPPEVVARVNAANRGKKRTQEARERMSAARMGVRPSPEAIAKTAEANRGRKRSPEAIEKTAEANRGRKRSPEAIENMRAAWARRKSSAKEI